MKQLSQYKLFFIIMFSMLFSTNAAADYSKSFESDDRTGDHKPYGIYLAYGGGIAKGVKLDRAEIIDLAPTILYAFNTPIPDDMDGKVMKEIFEFPLL